MTSGMSMTEEILSNQMNKVDRDTPQENTDENHTVSWKRYVWIGLLWSMFFYYNGMPIFPLGIVVIILLLMTRKKRNKDFQANQKKFLLISLISLIAWLVWFWLQIYATIQNTNYDFWFYISLTPDNIIQLFSPSPDIATIYNNSEFIDENWIFNTQVEELITVLNSESYDDISKYLYQSADEEEQQQMNMFEEQLKWVRYAVWEIEIVNFEWYQRRKEVINTKSTIYHSLRYIATVQNEPEVDKNLIVTFIVTDEDQWVWWINITPSVLKYAISQDPLPLWLGNVLQ